jgi:hypothetical protein
MRRIIITAFVLLSMPSLAALAMPRQAIFIRASAAQIEKRIEITAQRMEHDGALTHANGNVKVRIIHPDEGRTVIRPDEVIYHGDTGEIETRGDARITIEKAQ